MLRDRIRHGHQLGAATPLPAVLAQQLDDGLEVARAVGGGAVDLGGGVDRSGLERVAAEVVAGSSGDGAVRMVGGAVLGEGQAVVAHEDGLHA